MQLMTLCYLIVIMMIVDEDVRVECGHTQGHIDDAQGLMTSITAVLLPQISDCKVFGRIKTARMINGMVKNQMLY